ncbi:MAG: hypothetical protein JWL83_71 [Actinomycetia bacterium]|nr:hypothetical protein [Actinomycetes bacterium]
MKQIVHVMHGVPYDFYGGRPHPKVHVDAVEGWGNPFPITVNEALFRNSARGSTLADYVLWLIQARPDIIAAAKIIHLHEQVGACWCAGREGLAIDDPLRCHLQVLMRAARGDYDDWLGRL